MRIRNTCALFLIVGMCGVDFAWIGRHRVTVQSVNVAERESRMGNASRMSVGPSIALPTLGLSRQAALSSAPDFPDRLLVCSFEADLVHARNVSVAYVSLNAGNAWYRVLEDTNSDHVSETSCSAGSAGRGYFAASFVGPDRGQASGTAEIYRSFDGGLTWTKPSRFPFIDWTALAVTPSSSSLEAVYLFGNQIAGGIGDTGDGNWQQQRGLMLFSEDGERFSQPEFLPDQWTTGNRGALPLSTVILGDGSVLVLYLRSPNGSGKPALRLYRVKHHSWNFVSNIEMPNGLDVLNLGESQMAFDRNGHFSGRLYVAFPATHAGKAALGLSTSDDEGKTWRTAVFLEEDQSSSTGYDNSPSVGIAVNNRGILGVQWLAPRGCPIFAISTDGGSSIRESAMLGSCNTQGGSAEFPRQVAGRMLTTNVSGPVDQISGRPNSPESGFMMYEAETPFWGAQIAADAAGRFHALWSETRSDGSNVLLTAAISVDLPVQKSLDISHSHDVTENFQVKARQVRFDPYTMTFSVDVVVTNRASVALAYPSLLQVQSQYSDCGILQYLNPDAAYDGVPIFRVPLDSRFRRLHPGDDTLPIHLEVRIEGCDARQIFERRGISKANGQWFYPLSLRFRVLQLHNSDEELDGQ